MQAGDPADGTFRGYEVDLLEAIAARLQYTLEYRRAWWSLITEELVVGRLDFICSAATVTVGRTKEVSFCEPHLKLKLALVTRKDLSPPLSVQAHYGVPRGTTAEEYLRSTLCLAPTVLSESNHELYQALSSGEIDGVIDDSPIARHFSSAIPGLIYKGAYKGTEGAYAIMVAKDNSSLRSKLDATILQLESDGFLRSSRERWFGVTAILVD
jgi:polar amino acid transport system substrate-binding protein